MIEVIKKYWHVFWHFRKMHLMTTVERRADFVFWGGVSVMWTIFNVFFFSLILGVSNTIGGWSMYEMYVLLGVFSIIDSFTWGLFYFNMSRYTNSVYDGDLNSILLKPINPIFMLMTRYNNYNNSFRFFIGIGMTIWAVSKLDVTPSFMEVVLFICVLFLSMLCIYFIWFILSTFAFYFERLNNINEIIPNLRRVWQVPREVFPGFFAVILTYIFPMALVVSLPTEILTNKYNPLLLLYLLCFTLVTIIISYFFFTVSVKKYGGMAN